MEYNQTLNIVFGVVPWIVQVQLNLHLCVYCTMWQWWQKKTTRWWYLDFILCFHLRPHYLSQPGPNLSDLKKFDSNTIVATTIFMLVGSRAIEPSHDIQSSFLIPSIMDPHPALGTLSCFFSLESQSGVTFVGTGVVGMNYFYMGSRVIWLNKDKCWNIFTRKSVGPDQCDDDRW